MEKLDSCSFFNNKELFNSWFMDGDIDPGLYNECRRLMNEMIFELNWRMTMGVTVDFEHAGKELKGAHIVKDYGRYKSVFLDFLYSTLPNGKENKPENYRVAVYCSSNSNTFFLPHSDIAAYWSAGWPRHGWHPGRYVVEPWWLLKPIHDYLNDEISYEKLREATDYVKYIYFLWVFKYVYKEVYPIIRKEKNMDKARLKFFYDLAISLNKEQFKECYKPKNRYTGPLETTFPFSWFYDPEKMKNPFLRYYKELRDEYKKDNQKK